MTISLGVKMITRQITPFFSSSVLALSLRHVKNRRVVLCTPKLYNTFLKRVTLNSPEII